MVDEKELYVMKETIKDLCIEGLCTDGEYHKQWFLEEILKELGFDLKKLSRECAEEQAKQEGEDPDEYWESYCYGEYIWEEGMPP